MKNVRVPLLRGVALAAAALAASYAAHAQAQATPPAPAQAVAPSAAAPAPSRFLLNAVRFAGNAAVTTADLMSAVKPYVGRPVGNEELGLIATEVRRLYEARGLGLVAIGYPNQGLQDGVLQITVVEPTVARVGVTSGARPPVSAERVERVLARQGLRAGQPLDLLALDRAMFTLNDWPGVVAKTSLVPGGDEGSYSVDIATERARPWEASIDADNHGSRSSGRVRVGTLLRWNNPLSIGDNLDLRAVISSGSATTVGRLGYELPVGATPLRAGIGYSRVSYELDGVFAGANAVGSADVVDLSLSYPIVRSRETNLIGRLALEDKSLSDEFGTTTDKHIRAVVASASFESRDRVWGGGYWGGAASVQFGKLTDETTVAGASNVDATAVGSFRKYSAQVSRLQAITPTWSVFTGLAGQWASKNLDSAEKFTLGGAKGVRAYPAAEAPSDEGLIFNAELRWWLNPAWSTYAFYDAGHAKLQKQPTSTGDNTRSLHGYGLGLQFSDPKLFTLKATLGVRGKDVVQSEEDSRSRLLVQVQRSF
jgi:hemolysin activation/secretion protein